MVGVAADLVEVGRQANKPEVAQHSGSACKEATPTRCHDRNEAPLTRSSGMMSHAGTKPSRI